MARFITKVGKVVANISEAASAARKMETFCTPLVTMMDGSRGRRVVGKWKYLDGLEKRVYVLWAFGDHYPMYVYDEEAQLWYGNRTKWSNTTTKYMWKFQPAHVQEYFECEDMCNIARYGVASFVTRKFEAAA